MGRCIYCYGLIADDDNVCFTCGNDVHQQQQALRHVKAAAHPRRGASGRVDVVLFASLAVTAYSYFVEHAVSAPGALAIAAGLLLIRFLTEGHVNKNPR